MRVAKLNERREFLLAAAATAVPLLARGAGAAAPPAADTAHGQWHIARGPLLTRWAHEAGPHHALPEYPRPQMVRASWQSLNGLWDYHVGLNDDHRLPRRFDGRILVPFGIESALSGVMRPLLPHQRLWYHRTFEVPAGWHGHRVLLHFGAVDWQATLYIDGRHVGSHRGGYDSFSFDITPYVRAGGSHRLVVSVWDPTDTWWQPHGKQTLHPGGASYTATSGIWQTVWLEATPQSAIQRLVMTPDVPRNVLRLRVIARITPEPMHVAATVLDGQRHVGHAAGVIGGQLTKPVRANLVSFFKARNCQVVADLEVPVPNARLWSPADPFLYGLRVALLNHRGMEIDHVDSYCAMRSLHVGHDAAGNTRPMLNGKPILLPGALDQGFWPDGIYTAPTDEALRFDIAFARRLGLNAVRKHVKIEPERWYYWADKLGLIVFQDMPTGGDGNPRTDLPRSPEAAAQWRTEVRRHLEQLHNHPSIFCWIMFNEAFGGFDYTRNAQWAQRLDPSRFVDESSGFPWHGAGNVADNHGGIPPKFKHKFGITSEDGGWGLGCPGHEWDPARSWTYSSYDPKTGRRLDFLKLKNHDKAARMPAATAASRAWMTREVAGLYHNFLSAAGRTGQSGDFYCQIVDVETECDGLLSYDRAVLKVNPDAIRRAIDAASPRGNNQPA